MLSALLGAGPGSPACMLIAYTGICDFSSAVTGEWFVLDGGYPCRIEGPAAGAQTTGRSKLLGWHLARRRAGIDDKDLE